jgi:HD-like signal output (HDOD) protein/nitrogen-specific signal transduction histidine kinase
MDNAVQSILSKVDLNSLPVVPKVLLDLIKATQRNEVNLKELANIIGQDASLSSKVLAAANSSYYRQWGEVKDLNKIVVVLGMSTVKTIAITRSVQQFFSEIPHINHDFLELIWYRSLTCAHLAHRLAKLTSYPYPEESYLTGLLHRMGQLILLQCFPQEYPNFLKRHLDGQEGELEKQLFGANHNEVGGYLIESWKLQSFISDAVSHQYQSGEAIADSAQLVKILNLAGRIATMDSANKPEVLALADKLFGMNQPLIDDMVEEVGNLVRRSEENIGIRIGASEGQAPKCLTSAHQRESIRKSLGERIKTLMLASTVRQQLEANPDVNHLVGVILKDLSALFGFQVAAFFLFRPETKDLAGVPGYPEKDSLWSSVTIHLSPDHSLVAKCLLQRRIMHSFDACNKALSSIIDRQICRMLGAEGLMLVPLFDGPQNIGVIAIGISKSHAQSIALKADFITLFSREAARALLTVLSAERNTRQQAEELRENYRLHARKLAHEASNPLNIIQNYLYLLSKRLNDENIQEIRIIQDEIDRVGLLLRNLPDNIEHTAQDDTSIADVNALITDLANLFHSGMPSSSDVTLDLQLDKAIPPVAVSKNKLKQILINLIKNAMEASPPGGKITVSSKDNIYFGSGGFIEVRIEDQGPGLPEEVLQGLYSPVVSTKGKDHSGLGLTISKSLIDELKGMIRCDSSTAKGTVFYIYVPRIILKQDRKM